MYCDKCGQQLRDGAKFCNKCGNAVIVEKQEDHKAINRSLSNQSVKPTEIEPHHPIVLKEQTSSDKDTGKKKIIIIAGICCGVLLIGVIAFLLILNMPKTNISIYQGYVQSLSKAHDEIKACEEDTSGQSIAIVDMNGTDTDDIIFVTRKKISDHETKHESEEIVLNFRYDGEGKIKEKELAVCDDFALFIDARTKDLYQYELVPYLEDVKNERVVKLNLGENGFSETDSFCRYCNAETKEISYTDNEHGGEDYTSNRSDFENLKDKDVCVLVSSTDIINQQQVFDKITDDLSLNYDEAMSKLNGDNKQSTPDTSTRQTETQKPTEKPVVITDIDQSELPDGLTEFLQIFDFAYGTQSEGREYNCEKLDNIYDKLLGKIVGNPTIVDLKLYPGGDSKSSFSPNSDPLDKYPKGWGYTAVPKEKVIWILENVLNVPKNEIETIIQAAMQSDPDIYEYEENGITYLYNKISGLGGPGYNVTFETIRFDGEKYYFIYDCSDAVQYDGATTVTYYTEMAQREIDGKKYWSIYRHSENIPDLPEPTNEKKTDVFKMFEGGYTFTSGVGYWSSHIELKSDGTFTGEYHDQNAGESGNGYDGTTYLSSFSGNFTNPKKINAYTYSFELGEIIYENKPGTEKIETVGNSDYRMRTVYSEAYGLNGSKTIYAYTADAPISKLPEGFISWVGHLRSKETRNNTNLSYKCLYAIESECGWIGSSE